MPSKVPQWMRRPDGSLKGIGYLGEQKLPDGSVATEYSMANDSVGKTPDGNWRDFPLLVPSLTAEELSLLVNDVIPNRRPVPPSIERKATEHALARMMAGRSVWADESDIPYSPALLDLGGMPKAGAKGAGIQQQMQGALAAPNVMNAMRGRNPMIDDLARLLSK
jgi:hypothetical protein